MSRTRLVRCHYVPPHVLASIARSVERKGIEPNDAQRSAVVSDAIRASRERQDGARRHSRRLSMERAGRE